MRLALFALLLAAVVVKAGRQDSVSHIVKESIVGPPSGWIKHGPAPPGHLLELKIALPQPHFPILEQHLWEVSNPKHERYGAYLSKEETHSLMAPHPESLDAVSGWLSSYGIQEEHLLRSSAQDWVDIRVPVALAEEMLNTEYHVYIHSGSGESMVRTTSYSLPESIHEHIDLIQPTTMFTRLRPFKSTLHWQKGASLVSQSVTTGTLIGPGGNRVNASCNSTVTVTCLRQLYNAVGYKTSATNGNGIGITGYLEQYANDKDLQQFFKLENPAAYGSNYTLVKINGGLNNQTSSAAGIEANLDTQFAYGLTHPTPATFYSTGGSPPFISDVFTPTNDNEPYLNWLEYLSSQDYLPQTISTSYGDGEQTVPRNYAIRVCNGFAALGVRGVSLLFASGDYGVGDGDANPATQQCFTNHGPNRTEFIPTFPSTCPFVTSVGATHHIPETATNFSGGGFSNYFARPGYQEEVVSKFLKTLDPRTYEGLFNRLGRGFPDVSAQGSSYLIVYQGATTHVDGTSCSTPAFASFISMLNDARLSAGEPPLGFLNPWLYETAFNALNDVTIGNNPGCGTQGFNATAGWDPVTGLGTPNFRKLLELALEC